MNKGLSVEPYMTNMNTPMLLQQLPNVTLPGEQPYDSLPGWLAEEHGVRPPEVRLDVVGVLVPRTGRPQVEHVRGVG